MSKRPLPPVLRPIARHPDFEVRGDGTAHWKVYYLGNFVTSHSRTPSDRRGPLNFLSMVKRKTGIDFRPNYRPG